LSLTKIIAIPDIQAPAHDEKAVATALAIVKGERPDILIQIGDLCDLQSISRFKKRDWQEARQTADKEIEAANTILDRFDKVTPKTTKKIFLEGNHDKRLELFFVQNAAQLGESFKGIAIEEQLRLDERGYEYVRIKNQPYRVGHIGFIHGWFVNKYHAFKTVNDGRESLIYGHTHDHQTFISKHLDTEQPSIGMSIGCLCDYRQAYLEGRPTNWSHGVAVVYVDQKTGFFWPYFVPIINGTAVFNGKTYNP